MEEPEFEGKHNSVLVSMNWSLIKVLAQFVAVAYEVFISATHITLSAKSRPMWDCRW